ncbi:MAG TPA: LuxR C-terminal-related transcriptional regulator [Chloroflexia bacterium]|nr:LuxR C-terminal-related transcriptional regulator [Chloroflexia bacterium]
MQGTTRTKAGFHTLDTVLHTKFLIPPPRPQRVQRMRLLAGLRADPPPPVTLVAAPAGYGKTTLVADWITTDHRRAAWLTLDSSENEEGAFWTAVATALDSVQPGVSARALALLRQPQPPPLPTILTALLNDLTTHLTPDAAGQPVLLVLDDYHMITQRPIHETVTALIERLPPALRLVLTSRADPPLRLARLRVRAQLLEVRAADLAFAAPEVDTFLTETMGLTLPAAVAPALLARTEGWVAALQLAALSLRTQADPAGFLASFGGSHRHLLGYLVEEVFSQQPPALQAFLLATCVLDRMCADLCNAVLAPAGGAQAILAALDAANLFVVALDRRGAWYRYHPLFAEMLLHRLRQQDPAGERALRRRASAWYEQAGAGAEAIQQALAGSDWATAARLIEQFADDVRRRGEFGLLDRWLGALPAAVRAAAPGLGFWQAVRLMMAGQAAAAETLLTAVEQDLARLTAAPGAESPAAIRTLRSNTLALRVLLTRYRLGDPAQVADLARAALDQLPPDAWDWRALVLDNLAAALYLGDDLAGAGRHYEAAIALSEQAHYYLLTFLSRARFGSLLADRGELRAAQAYYVATRQLATDWAVLDLPAAGHIDWFAACLHYEANDLAAAEVAVQRAIARADAGHLIELQGLAHLTWCRIRLAQADPAGARAALAGAEARLTPPTAPGAPDNARLRAALAAWRATIALAHPDPETGGPAAPEPPAAGPGGPVAHWIWRAAQLLPARRWLQAGDAAAAHADLESRSAQAAARGAQGLLITVLALDALALEAQGRPAAARAALRRAVRLAAAEGYVRAILDAGPALGPLLQALAQDLARSPEHNPGLAAYLTRLTAAPGAETGSPAEPAATAAPAELPSGPFREPLTARELAILRHLAAGGSNQEIANQLILGVSTVKWYLQTIYAKLEVQNRTQAVARGRALGLIR